MGATALRLLHESNMVIGRNSTSTLVQWALLNISIFQRLYFPHLGHSLDNHQQLQALLPYLSSADQMDSTMRSPNLPIEKTEPINDFYGTNIDSVAEKKLLWKCDLRVLPPLFVLFLLAFLGM